MFFSHINLYCMHENIKTKKELLFTAAENNDAEKIKELLEQKMAAIDDRRDNDGKTAVCIAASRGKYEALKELLRHNPDVNLPDNDGWTPLKKAADYGYLECARLLLAVGADPNKADKQGYTPLINTHKNLEMAQLLLDAGANVNHITKDGKTALFWAVVNSHFETLELLVKRGATDSSKCISRGLNARSLANINAENSHSSYPDKTTAEKCADFLNEKFGK